MALHAALSLVPDDPDADPDPVAADRRRRLGELGSFAGSVAHDFNNVLQAVAGFASLIASSLEDADPGLAELAADLLESCERGTALTRQLFLFAGRQRPDPQPVDLDSAVSRLAATAAGLLPGGVSLDVRTSSRATVLADPAQLEQIVLELVGNARDAMPDGGTVGIRTSAAPAGVLVEVTDTGTGIPPEEAERVFEPFFTTKPRGRGTGLGLSIVEAMVTRLGGDVGVVTEPGRGSTFTVTLPPLRA